MKTVYEHICDFVNRYPGGVYWNRLKKHSEVVQRHLNPDEEVLFAFAGQKNDSIFDIFSTAAIVLTNKRILIGQKRVLFGYQLNIITPDMFNDMQIYEGLLWGRIVIDTIKECVTITNLAKNSLPEIETKITSYMMEEKKKYVKNDN